MAKVTGCIDIWVCVASGSSKQQVERYLMEMLAGQYLQETIVCSKKRNTWLYMIPGPRARQVEQDGFSLPISLKTKKRARSTR